MSYEIPATSKTPALIIYLLDISKSMNQLHGGQRKIDTVLAALKKVVVRMVHRSTKGMTIAPRYRVALFGYHAEVIDLLGGIQTIGALAERGLPTPQLAYGTQTAKAFAAAERLLLSELPRLRDCPAPLICHLTDGLFGGDDPQSIVDRIRKLAVPDGAVLVENIFTSQKVLEAPIQDVQRWSGLTRVDQLGKPYAQKLFGMSSPIPDSYLQSLSESGYSLQPGARMLFPGDTPEVIELGFAMSAATPLTRRE
jgi:hypothetical protein